MAQTLRSRDALMALYAGYGNTSSSTALTSSSCTDRRTLALSSSNTMSMVKIVATGSSYDNRFISVVTIEGRKIVQWRDYMDSLAAMTALSQVQ